MTATVKSEKAATFPGEKTTKFRRRLLAIVGVLSLVVGFGSFLGGAAGAVYTWQQAAVQNIVTPDDAAIPETPVRGPFTMWAQSDIITHHQLDSTEGLYYAEMPRQVPEVDEAGNPVIGEDGEPVMVPNAARASWITATTLTTALGVGILAYALAAFAMVVGVTLVASGLTFLSLRKALIA